MTLSTLHHRALDLEFAGHSAKEIARQLHRAHGTIRNWQTDPEYKELRKKRADEVAAHATETIKGMASEAAESLRRLMSLKKPTQYGDVDDGATQLGAAKEVLNRACGKPAETIKHANDNEEPFLIQLAPSQFLRTPEAIKQRQQYEQAQKIRRTEA